MQIKIERGNDAPEKLLGIYRMGAPRPERILKVGEAHTIYVYDGQDWTLKELKVEP
jgi:hypothetical protein